MEKVVTFFQQYYERILTWYGELTYLEQMGVLFIVIVIAFGIVAYILIKKAAGT